MEDSLTAAVRYNRVNQRVTPPRPGDYRTNLTWNISVCVVVCQDSSILVICWWR